MLQYSVHRFEINGRHYLLLPKLNTAQMTLVTSRLHREGFSINGTDPVRAESQPVAIRIFASGFCWSSTDPSDWLLPSMPEVLGCGKEEVSPAHLVGLYLGAAEEGRTGSLRVTTRLEGMRNWYSLRSSGGCGLAPDERLIVCSLLSKSDASVPMVTDFPSKGSRAFIAGRRSYFDSKPPCKEAAETLRTAGTFGSRNSYLPRDGILKSRSIIPSRRDLLNILEEAGEWCSFKAE